MKKLKKNNNNELKSTTKQQQQKQFFIFILRVEVQNLPKNKSNKKHIFGLPVADDFVSDLWL